MLHIDTPQQRELLLTGSFGLEKEGLRVDEAGFLAHTPHPFPDSTAIVRDFCENQTEINTGVSPTPGQAVAELWDHTRQIHRTLAALSPREYLWPFSNPPYIRREADVPIAQFRGRETGKTAYREYLSKRYGRYKMSLSGIHVNYSFSDALLRESFARAGGGSFFDFKNRLYLSLAQKAAAYSWLLVALTAASPLLDCSYVEKGRFDEDIFQGLASVRCSELGYWNAFVPVFDYSSLEGYAASIRGYVTRGWLKAPSELYYPVRLKPPGENRLSALEQKGIDHIELRMFDLNPLVPAGLEERDVAFAQLLLCWLAATPDRPLTDRDQVQAVQNCKNAAHYDLKTVSIVTPDGAVSSVARAGRNVLDAMKDFYAPFPAWAGEVLAFQEAKLADPERRYAWQVRRVFSGGYVKKGLALARQRQEEAYV